VICAVAFFDGRNRLVNLVQERGGRMTGQINQSKARLKKILIKQENPRGGDNIRRECTYPPIIPTPSLTIRMYRVFTHKIMGGDYYAKPWE